MTLTYTRGLGRLTATDNTQPGAPFVFDTNDGLLFVDPDDFFEGSIAVPNRTASSQGVDGAQNVVDIEQDYYVGTPTSPGSRYVRGLIRTTAASAGEAMDGIWRQASGTHIDVMDGVSITSVPQSDLGGFQRLATLGGYTFFVNELGHLVMRERIVARARDPGNPGTTINRVRQNVTVDYRLLVGSFFGADFTVRPGVSFRSASRSSVNHGSSVTISDLPIGYAYPARRIVALVTGFEATGSAPDTPVSITIGGVSATIHGTVLGTGTNENSITVASALVPTGSTVSVTVVWPDGQYRTFVDVYAIVDQGSTPVITGTSVTGASSISHSVTVADDQIGIAVAAIRGGSTTGQFTNMASWTNAVFQQSASFPGTAEAFVSSAIIPPGSGLVSVGASWVTTGDVIMLAAVWG